MAVKTCKKDCTLDSKEKFVSEAGRRPRGGPQTRSWKRPETVQTRRQGGPGARAGRPRTALAPTGEEGCAAVSRLDQPSPILTLDLRRARARLSRRHFQ